MRSKERVSLPCGVETGTTRGIIEVTTEDDRVWVIFDWDEKGWASFVSDPSVPPILHAAGHVGVPQAAVLGGQYDA